MIKLIKCDSLLYKYSSILYTRFSLFKFNKLNFSEVVKNNTTKVLTIEYDDNNNRKIVYKDFNEYNKEIKTTKNPPKKISNHLNKIKVFGSESLESKIEENSSDNHLDFKEEVNENLISYDQFFSDFCRIYVKGGNGGNGCFSFLKGPMFDQKTPQGGDGGKGGDVILIADESVGSLSALRKAHYLGNEGKKGYVKAKGGKNGKDIVVKLPVGTIINEIIRDEDYKNAKRELRSDKNYKLKQLLDLDEHGKTFVICHGGKPGIGNFTKKNIEKGSPYLKGREGEERELVYY